MDFTLILLHEDWSANFKQNGGRELLKQREYFPRWSLLGGALPIALLHFHFEHCTTPHYKNRPDFKVKGSCKHIFLSVKTLDPPCTSIKKLATTRCNRPSFWAPLFPHLIFVFILTWEGTCAILCPSPECKTGKRPERSQKLFQSWEPSYASLDARSSYDGSCR